MIEGNPLCHSSVLMRTDKVVLVLLKGVVAVLEVLFDVWVVHILSVEVLKGMVAVLEVLFDVLVVHILYVEVVSFEEV